MILAIAIVLVLLFPWILLGGWVMMLCLGALAHIFGVAGLALGFWQSTLVSVIIGLIFG